MSAARPRSRCRQALTGGAALHQHERRPRAGVRSDGIAEDVISALSHYPSLFVIARNSTFTTKAARSM